MRGGYCSISNGAIDWSLNPVVSCRVAQIFFLLLCVTLFQQTGQGKATGVEPEVIQGSVSIKRLAQVLIFKKSRLTTNRIQHPLCNIFIVILFKIKLRITVFALIFMRGMMLRLTSLYMNAYIGFYINWFLNSVQV